MANKVLKETDYLSFNINGFIVDENIIRNVVIIYSKITF